MFVYGDNVFSVFAVGNKLVIYRDAKLDSEVSLDSLDIEVLEMIVDSPKSQLMILGKTKSTLKTYIVSLANGFQVTPQSETSIDSPFESTSVSKNKFILHGQNAQELDMKLQTVKVHKKSKVQTSPFDDLLIVDDGTQFIGSDGKSFEKGCKVLRS